MSSVSGRWSCLTSKNEQLRRSSQCLTVIGKVAYLFGGELEPRKPRDNTVYSIALNAIDTVEELVQDSSVAAAPTPRVGAASTALHGKLYCFGGRGGVSMTCLESKGSFDVFDGHSWSVGNPMHSEALPEDRSYHSMTSDNNNTMYLHAGCPAKGRLNDLWAFDVTTSTWRRLASAPGEGRGGTSIAYSSTGKLYRINGFDGKEEQGGAVDVYDIKTDKWSSILYKPDGVEGPEPRSVATFVPITTTSGKEMLVTMFGEGSPSDLGHAGAGRMFSDVWAFDVNSEKWLRVVFKDGEAAPAPRGWFDADVWKGSDAGANQVVVHGGLHDNNQRLNDVWLLKII